jgi:hypothetical protein
VPCIFNQKIKTKLGTNQLEILLLYYYHWSPFRADFIYFVCTMISVRPLRSSSSSSSRRRMAQQSGAASPPPIYLQQAENGEMHEVATLVVDGDQVVTVMPQQQQVATQVRGSRRVDAVAPGNHHPRRLSRARLRALSLSLSLPCV